MKRKIIIHDPLAPQKVIEIIQVVLAARAGHIFFEFFIFLDANFHSLTEFILAIGVVMLVIVLFGSVGIVIENLTMIMIVSRRKHCTS